MILVKSLQPTTLNLASMFEIQNFYGPDLSYFIKWVRPSICNLSDHLYQNFLAHITFFFPSNII